MLHRFEGESVQTEEIPDPAVAVQKENWAAAVQKENWAAAVQQGNWAVAASSV